MKERLSDIPVAMRLAVLADRTRLRLLRVLEGAELSVGELAQVFQSPQSTISRHLKVLADAGWIVRRNEGTATFYRMVLDDLTTPARALWVTIRDQPAQGDRAEHTEDVRRVAAVLDERRTDSQAYFGRVAGEWDEVRHELFGTRFTLHALLGLISSSWVVADLGCGTGNIAELLAPVVKRVIAVDQSGPMIEAAKRRLKGVKNVEFVESELSGLPLASGSVDVAAFGLVLHHLPKPEAALKEAARILRTGAPEVSGRVLVVDMVRHDRSEYRHLMGHQHLGFSREDVESRFELAGLVPMTFRELPVDPDARGPGLFVATARAAAASGGAGRQK
ncbi:MAG: metalloregulator ArsR/SmtB family transcription factor [Phycisphaerae bacterium]|nr:metalloregulator ArsR/SmtB family transcription factor [Phycisphaerae bacterium]MBN8599038.1 metalloregulator ArsR/SmtB family transcription factor [Planctomycetota bacterium]